MLGIDPHIVKHEIITYPDAKHVRKILIVFNPQKYPAIKEEMEKLLNASFIYPVPLTEWVSNLVPIYNMKGTICVCMDFSDLKKAFPKDNFPTTFINEILNKCVGSNVFYFMDGFS
jgi:hypothetical protein